ALSAPTSVTNVASVSGGSDTNTSNNSVNDTTTINAAADLTIAKSHSGNFIQGHIGATYTISVSNIGGTPTSGTVTVTDALPSGLTATAMSGTGWSCTVATLTCTRGDALAAGAAYPAITLTVNVASNAPASVTNVASVSGGGDAIGTNNSVSDPTTIVPPTTVRVYLVSGGTWIVPSNWNSANNTIEVIGGGGGGANGPSDGFNGGGGGGGAYAKSVNVTLTPNTNVAYAIGGAGGVGGAGGDTWFCNSTANCASMGGAAVVVGAQ